MDINSLRSFITVLTFVVFIAIIVWAWSGRRKSAFEQAALLPFADANIEVLRQNRTSKEKSA
ncbi:MAG: cbb3-type cytochrome c oxidase subunit 3 [Burkholderiales bacterium]